MKTRIVSIQSLEWVDRETGKPVVLYTINYYGSSRSHKCLSRYYDQNDMAAGRIPSTILRFMECHQPTYFDTRVDFFTPAKAGYWDRTKNDT